MQLALGWFATNYKKERSDWSYHTNYFLNLGQLTVHNISGSPFARALRRGTH